MLSSKLAIGQCSTWLIAIFIFLATTSPALPTASTSVMDSYNQACIASLAGQTDSAMDHFKKALAAGFDDFRYALADSELSNLTQTAAFSQLYTVHQSRLTLLSSERGLDLTSDLWSDWQELAISVDPIASTAAVRLKWQPQTLEMEIRLSGELADLMAKPQQPPWYGGPGVMLTLAIVDGTSPFESSNTFQFSFGKNKTDCVGAIHLGDLLGWQPVAELNPEINILEKGHSTVLKASINWQSILPHHPLVDSHLGLNLAIRGENKNVGSFSLFPDPQALSPTGKIHRFVPLNFDLTSEARESLAGRLNHSLLAEDPLTCDLIIVSSESGLGRLKVDFLDHQGHSVLPEGAAESNISCETGVNSVTRTADFTALEMGPYLVKVELEMPSGESLRWSSQVLNLGLNWTTTLQNQISQLTPQDQPTAQYYFKAIVQAAETLAPRRHPGRINTTLQMLNSLIKAGTEEGSILPNTGLMALVWQDHQGNDHLCSVYLPAGFREANTLEPLVLLTDSHGSEGRLAGRIAQLHEHQDTPRTEKDPSRKNFPIYLIPHWDPNKIQSPDQKISELVEFNQWAEEFFKCSGIALAAVDATTGLALDYCHQGPSNVSKLLVFAGAKTNPWPDMKNQQLLQRFSGDSQTQTAITWIDFPLETRDLGKSEMLVSVLQESGYNIDVQEVRGGLSMTQVTDRLVLWVEKTPQ